MRRFSRFSGGFSEVFRTFLEVFRRVFRKFFGGFFTSIFRFLQFFGYFWVFGQGRVFKKKYKNLEAFLEVFDVGRFFKEGF